MMMINTSFVAQILILIYTILTFVYSVYEKLTAWKESVVFYQEHFKSTFLNNKLPFLLKTVILLELITVVLCLLGLFSLIVYDQQYLGLYGLIVASCTLIILMLGQRIAKDYDGAKNITVYFILTVFGVFLLQ